MQPVLKGFLIGCSILLVLGIAAIGTGIWYVNKNKDRYIAAAKDVETQAEQFGRTATPPECVTEALRQYRANSSFKGQLRTRIWLGGWLDSTAPDAAFCTNVPAKSEFARTVTWRMSECTRLGFQGDSACGNLLIAVQDHCEKQMKK